MNFSNSVRTTLELSYGDEVRDLRITFDLIDRVRGYIPWEELAIELGKENPVPNLTMMAKFVFLNLREAGFSPDIDKIYNEMFLSEEGKQAYITLVSQIILAYQPSGSSKKKTLTDVTTAKQSSAA
jgi:hypothetical protein